MAVVGYGIDVVSVERIERAIDRFGKRFLQRVFTDAEREFCLSRRRPAESFAVRFGAKEAFVKACGAEGVLAFSDVEVVRGSNGAPKLSLKGRASKLAASRGARNIFVSLSHDAGVGVAGVVLEGEKPERP